MSQSFTLARVLESVPEKGLDFEYCAVQTEEKRTFMLCNPTSSTVHFNLQTDEQSPTFSISPQTGKFP